VSSGTVWAQSPADQPSVLTFEDALRRALEEHPRLKAANLGIEAAEGRVQQAGLRPNPELVVDLENFSGDLPGFERSDTSILLSQRIEIGGKRGARVAVAEADRALSGRDLDAARLDLVRDVRSDFALALAAQRRLALADETLAIAREVAATAQRKVAAGALPMVEATRARVAISTAEIESERARGLVRVALERLALNWGGSPLPERVEGNLDSLATVSSLDSLVVQLAGNPDLARWTNLADFQRARIRLEESKRSLDLSVGGGYRRFAAGDNGALLLSLSLDVPVLNRNQGAVREASAQLGQTTFELEQTRRALERVLRDHAARLRIAQVEVRGLRQNVLPGAQEVYEGVRQGYEQGRFTYLDVLEARRSLALVRESEITALSELEQSRIEIERLIGQGEAAIDRVQEGR
jgi:cobalt-zinc-cadmium efflux system outer membrane protein